MVWPAGTVGLSMAVRGLSIVAVLLVAAFSLGGCSARHQVKLPPRAELLPPERVYSKIRKRSYLPEDRRLAACRDLVFVGRTWPAPGTEKRELDEIIVEDGPELYFDNRTGRLVANCSFWYCTKHSAECVAGCPPREWSCVGIDTGKPETEEEFRRRSIGIIPVPSAREIREIEARLAMPVGAEAISNYFRYYWAEPESGTRWIRGKFIAMPLMPGIRASEGNPGLAIEYPGLIPKVMGAGCQVVELRFDPRTETVDGIQCAGLQ